MNPLTRNILIVGITVIVLTLVAGVYSWVLPVESKISDLKRQIDTKIVERREALKAMQLIEASSSVLKDRMAALGEFDLRKEEQPASVLDGRANAALIKLSSILEEASLSVVSIDPVPKSLEDISLASGTPPVASIVSTNYSVHVQGNYTYMLAALAQFDSLPPTLEVEGYKLKYLEKDGLAARCDLTIDLAFKFLTPPSTGTVNPNEKTGFDELFEDIRRNARQSWLPAEPVAWLGRAKFWLMPPAMAAEVRGARSEALRRLKTEPDRPGVRLKRGPRGSSGQERLRRVPVRVVTERLRPVKAEPVVALAPLLVSQGIRSGWGLPLGALPPAAPATGDGSASPSLAQGNGRPGTAGRPERPPGAATGVKKRNGLVIGKAEPFWPIIEASDDIDMINVPSASAPLGFITRPAAPILPPSLRVNGQAIYTPTPAPTIFAVVATPKPLPTPKPAQAIIVRGIVMVGDRSRAIIVMDGVTRRVSEGDLVAAGLRVRTIDRSGVVFDGEGGPVRRELSRTWNPVSGMPETQGGLAPALVDPGARGGGLPGGLPQGALQPGSGVAPLAGAVPGTLPMGLPNPAAQVPAGPAGMPPPLPVPGNPGRP
ncbi:MAG: hypothetical protein VKO21_04860 [Candidatus Sericytochromatia bacterium]|nr:hypothetical protein [Candidatus Sericytochromatia bacterium]